MKKKNIIIIISIIVILAIIGLVCLLVIDTAKKTDEELEQQESEGISILTSIYNKLKDASTYTFSLKLNDENQITYAKKDDKASVEIIDEGEKDNYIVNDGNTYLLVEKTKEYYKYENNTMYLTQVINNMEELLNKEFKTGKETIDNKEYKYEEFDNEYPFILNYKTSINPDSTKTRLYFDGKELKYIKTYVGEVEQLLKVDISYNNIDNNKFEIPKEYKEG